MSKIAVIYWSGTGNTEAMADLVANAATAAGASVDKFTASEFNVSSAGDYTGFALGCPAMGAEVLEEEEFEPMFSACKAKLSGKKIALFGSYGWGGESVKLLNAELEAMKVAVVHPGVRVKYVPRAEELAQCFEMGRTIGRAIVESTPE